MSEHNKYELGPKVSFFLPVRKGSKRIENKNTTPFAGFKKGLVEVKLRQLLNTKSIDEVILSTNDGSLIEFYNEKFSGYSLFKLDVRSDHLCQDIINHSDLIDHAAKVTKGDYIILGHCTSPLVDSVDYDDIVYHYFDHILESGYDSLMTVKPFQNFLFTKGTRSRPYNFNGKNWPRTQDLVELAEVDSAVFMTSRYVYENIHQRIGHNPYLYRMNSIKSLDVDWPEDFLIAEAVYQKVYGNTIQ